MKFMKKLVLAFAALAAATSLTACNEAETVKHNIQEDADKFSVYRRMTFVNLRTDKMLYQAEGYFSVQTTDSQDAYSEIGLIFKVGPSEFKMDYFSVAANVVYVIEQAKNTTTDPYHWVITWYVPTPTNVAG
jgi:predicted small secreted protein